MLINRSYWMKNNVRWLQSTRQIRVRTSALGASSSPGIFQRILEQFLQNIPMTVVYLEDILITGRPHEEHDRNMAILAATVLMPLQDAGLCLKKEKCAFRQKSWTYLDHAIDADGIHPTEDKVRA